MYELPAELTLLLETAQAPHHTLSVRLRALGLLAQTIDAAFTEISERMSTLDGVRPATPTRQWPPTTAEVATLFAQISQIVRDQITALLEQHQICISPLEQLSAEQRSWVQAYFSHRIYPLLTPLAVDPGHPFPYISSDSLNYLVLLKATTNAGVGPGLLYARVKVPRHAVPRLVWIPPLAQGTSNLPAVRHLVWSADIVRYFSAHLFPGMTVTGLYQFHLLRAACACGEEGGPGQIKQQKFAPVVRLDIEERSPAWLVRWLLEHLEVTAELVVRCPMPLGIASLADLADYITPLLAQEKGKNEENEFPIDRQMAMC